MIAILEWCSRNPGMAILFMLYSIVLSVVLSIAVYGARRD